MAPRGWTLRRGSVFRWQRPAVLVPLGIVATLTAALVTALASPGPGSRTAASPAPAGVGVAPDRARVAPSLEPSPTPPSQDPQRARAVRQLLDARAAAVLGRDRDAFLATVDPRATALRARQAAAFDALAAVPLGAWDYVLDPARSSLPDRELDRRYGAGDWWAPGVALRYGLAGFDARPVVVDHHLTFVRRSGRWLLGADDDFVLQGRPTPRALWDRGPVVAHRARGVLVLAHPGQDRLARQVAALAADAVPRVTRVWGPWSGRVVVVVPDNAQELSGLLGSDGDLSQIAALATAELRGGAGDYDPTGDRVLINPEAFAGLGRLGRRVVLTHEVTHVATRRASGPAVPAWLAEGLADLVAYSELDLPASVTARELRREVRGGRVPEALPSDAAFDGANPRLAASYQGAELAVRLLVERHGRPAVLALYREIGARRGVSSEQALEDALRRRGTTVEELTAAWRAALTRQLG